jgi:hypothetical protein
VGGSANELPFTFLPLSNGSRDGPVGIATGYDLEAQDSIPEKITFSLLDSVQTGLGSHPASYLMNTGRSFNGGRAVEA